MTDDFPILYRTPSSVVYQVQAGVWLVVPTPGRRDDQESAEENVAAAVAHLPQGGLAVVRVVLFDGVGNQDRGARQVYAGWSEGAPDSVFLVGGSRLARALIAFYGRFNTFRVPLRVFATLEEALPAARERALVLGWEPT